MIDRLLARHVWASLLAIAVLLLAAEPLGLRRYVNRFEERGNVFDGYYWLFQTALGATLVLLALSPGVRRLSALVFMALGAGMGYVLSSVIFHAELLDSLGGVAAARDRWEPLGATGTTVAVLMSPIVLLGPVFGVLLFAIQRGAEAALRSRQPATG